MKASLLYASLFAVQGLAFPSALLGKQKDISSDELARITALLDKVSAGIEKRQLGLDIIDLGFDANAQKVENSGSHAYKAPGKNDLRGPCPGLNVLANHGYISRNGLTNSVDLTLAAQKVFGMGLDIGAFLSVYTSVMDGNLATFSIGGAPQTGLLGSLGLLGKPQGLSGSHNRFEGDASPLRADLYTSGDPVSLRLDQFKQLTDMPLGPRGYDLTVLNPFRRARHDHSVSTNGHYFAGPFTHYAVNVATHMFTYRFLANASAEYTDGYLDLNTLMAFQGVTRDSNGNFEWKAGRERIPDNWYRRRDDYTLPFFVKDAVESLIATDLGLLGGNTGEPNTFTGVDLTNLTGGAINAKTLLEGNNAMCVAFWAVNTATPDILRGLLGNVLAAVQKLTTVLNPVLQELGCPQLAKFDMGVFEKYPGYQGGL